MIPRVEEPEEKRRYRLLAEKVDELRSIIEAKQPEMPPLDAKVPDAIAFAAEHVVRFQKATQVALVMNDCGQSAEARRDPTTDELMSLGAACELLTDYFDRHNHKKQRAPKRRAR